MAVNSIGTDYSWLFNTNNNTKKQDSIAQLWSNYNSSQNNAASSLAGITEINNNLKSLLASYDEAKTTFTADFNENMNSLSKSAAQVQNYNFNVEQAGAITTATSTDENGKTTTTTTYSKELQAAIKTVEDFVGDYNSAVSFFNDNASVSNRVANMAKIFGDATYRSGDYQSIGLITQSDGSFKVDEATLANAIVNNPNHVSNLLGKDGLAGKAQSHVEFANSQSDKLFPSADSMFGDQIQAASLYTGKAYRNMSNYANMGNLLNMMF